jgi:hypothetical protein
VDEHRGFVDLVIRDGIVTLADVSRAGCSNALGVWTRRPPAAIEHEAPSHRRLGSSEIIVVLGCKSARFDHLTRRVHLAGRNP